MMDNTKMTKEQIIAFWDKNQIIKKVRDNNINGKKYFFLDGPPYVTGDLHPGHIWVKSLKDAFVRYKRYRKFNVIDRAGYDVHGLPIENKVEKELNLTSKKEIESRVGMEEFINKCESFVTRYIGRMDADYALYGVSLNFKDPYLPFKNEYMQTAWGVFKKISDKGLLYQGTKTLVYCPHCETPLSQGSMEVEYKDEDDPSVYILFKVETKNSKNTLKLSDNAYLLIWTTTPWTIPSNMAIAANPDELYVEAKIAGKNMILAKKRLDSISVILNENVIILHEFYGSQLNDLKYISPIEDNVPIQKEFRRYHKVIMSKEIVGMSEGSGLVHIAPGNGIDDYHLGLKNHIPIFSPINPDATYSEEGGAYSGIKIPIDANKRLIDDLTKSGALINRGSIRHSYPHCWRCSSKLIFLATKQWFLNVQKVKKQLLKMNQKINWCPSEVKKWQDDILSNSPDWCISRQRYWGIPMPIWECKSCNEITIIASIAELERFAKNKEYVNSLKNYHRPYIDKVILVCPKCAGEQHRIKDIFDVWFDSSIAFRASLSDEEFSDFTSTDLVVEYVEQIRGWFQYMLKIGIMAYGKNPFKNIIVHGIMAGNDGRKMSKSFGNYKPLSELSNYASPDAFRLWSLKHEQIQNRDLDEQSVRDQEKPITILENISNLLIDFAGAYNYTPSMQLNPKLNGMEEIDIWLISKIESLVQLVTNSMDMYKVYEAALAIERFIIEDFSRFYIKSAKKRIKEENGSDKILSLIDYVLYRLIVLISPITPFVSERIYHQLYACPEYESIFLLNWPKIKTKRINKQLEIDIALSQEVISTILNARERMNLSLKQPLKYAKISVYGADKAAALIRHSQMLKDYTNIKEIEVIEEQSAQKEIKPVFTKLGPSFKSDAQAIAQELKIADANLLLTEIEKQGYYTLQTSKGPVRIFKEHFDLVQKSPDAKSFGFSFGYIYIDIQISDELKDEYLEREFVRGIQVIRKTLGLKQSSTIQVNIKESEQYITQLILKKKAQISNAIKSRDILISNKDASGEWHELEVGDVKILVLVTALV